MALGRRDILIASFGGLLAWGLLVEWLPVLRFLGYSFAFGAALTALTIGALVVLTVRDGFDHRARPVSLAGTSIAFLSPQNWEEHCGSYRVDVKYQPEPLYPQSFIVSAALDELLQFAIRDFIRSWYGNISSNLKFANEIDRAIRTAIHNLRARLESEDLVEILVSRIVPILTAHFKEFDKAERAVRGKNLTHNVTESEELDIAIASRYRDGNLHPATSPSFPDKNNAQQNHLRKIVVSLLPGLVPSTLLDSRAVSILIREIIACAILFPLMDLLADPDSWNQLVEAYGQATIQDRKTVRKLRAALDQHASAIPRSKRSQQFPKLAPNDSERDFERFVRAIRRCNNLSDARKFRSHIASQLKRENMIDGQDQVYLRRLETGKRVLDQKVAKLSALGGHSSPQVNADLRYSYISKPHEVSLVDIMHNASGLSYFMEYMDRHRLMSLVQFWIVVDGFRNPLEDDFGDDTPTRSVTWTATDRNDMILISENHLSKPELRVPEESRKAVKEFISAGKRATPEQYRRARTAILTTQSMVLEEMQNKYYPGFQKSDLYYKYLASDEAATVSSAPLERKVLNRSPASDMFPAALQRTGSQSSCQSRDMRKPFPANEAPKLSLLTDALPTERRSLLDSPRAPLFSDEIEPDPMESSTYSPGQGSHNGDGEMQDSRIIANMEAALNDIMSNEPHEIKPEESKSGFGSPFSLPYPVRDGDSARSSFDSTRPHGNLPEKPKPSIASLGLVNTSSRIGVFTDDDLFPDQKKFIEDEYADEVMDETQSPEDEIHEAAPGDLGLTEAISALSADIEKLMSQEAIVGALTRKAELTNNTAELRILGKSRSSLQREIRRKEMQRQQYILQESDNSLYGRSTVQIKSIIVGKEEDGREYALYLIEVTRKAGEQMPAASWAVPRRYSEFHELHHQLRTRYPAVRPLEFPRRRVVMKLQKDFLHKRRLGLEAYLQQLLLLPDVCRSRELRAFLSQRAILPATHSSGTPREGEGRDLVTRIYNSVTDSVDDILGSIPVFDQLSAAGQNLISAATTQRSFTPQPGLITPEDSLTAAEAEAELSAFEDRELEPFVKPICDIFLEIFELNKGNNWLRGRAVVVVLHQLLGGTIERKIRDNAKSLVQDTALLRYISLIKDTMWPGGKLRENKPRTLAEKMKSRTDASVVLATLIPDLAGSVVGRANAQAAARRIFATTNNRRLNLHLAYEILDEIVEVLLGSGR
ncbi:Intermediate filament protein [Coccidioides posadasii str. Silveira]|uniref:Intermediate filament protein Mdm1 n=1 Tax=Coccidioides posadasii (strain RMSCC 757 / Silveira) TaxID=443226 RepID=E9CS24_COCPS|nr:intermediate filament protein Mdm1 [Coccidioides posadasii str. Silveira]QVM12202.1 Intermediate filament protein [Coccidioides posadasii str. Silveira]